jgi:hypothetical protein
VFSCSKSEQKQLNTWVSFQSAEQPLLGQFSVSGNISHLSQMRQMAESTVQQKINTLDIMHQYGPADGLTGSNEYRPEIMNLTHRIQGFTGNLQEPDWPDRMEDFFDCTKFSAGLIHDATKLVATDLCDSFALVRASRDKKNDLAKEAEDGLLSAVEIHIYPLFFALGLAIRLGRTTADFRRKWPEKKACPATAELGGNEPEPDALP